MDFEWDRRKAEANFKKHGVTFDEAATVFHDPLSATARDPDHSFGEHRYVVFGVSSQHRLLVVSHTERGNMIRIISARPATKNERKIYEEG